MQKLLRIAILFLNLFGFSFCFAQLHQIQFQHLSVNEGLSDNDVAAFTQDSLGFIWVGTNDGLNRFDGYKVKVFLHKPNDTASIPANQVRSLFTDSRGNIWVGTINGLAFFDNKTEHFHRFTQSGKNQEDIPHNTMSAIAEDVSDNIWIGTNEGLYTYVYATKKFHHYISGYRVHDICFSKDGIMWFNTESGISCCNLTTMSFASYALDSFGKDKFNRIPLGKIAIDKQGLIWSFLYNTMQIVCFDTKTRRYAYPLLLPPSETRIMNNYVRSIFVDRDGTVWFGTNQGGLISFSPDKKILSSYPADPLNENSLHDDGIVSFFQDRSGMIWLGLAVAGSDRFDPGRFKFDLYQPHSNITPTLSADWVRAFAEDAQHHLWIGTVKGISVLDRNTGAYTNFEHDTLKANSLSNNSVRALCRDQQGNIWVGTAYGLNLFDSVHSSFKHFFSEQISNNLRGNFVGCLICRKNGDLLIGTNTGMAIYHPPSHQFTNFHEDSLHRILNNVVRTIYEDNHAIIWIGIWDHGLVRYNAETGALQKFSSSARDSTSIVDNEILSITQDHQGLVWIGTVSGLCCYHEGSHSFKTYSTNDGLPDDHVSGLLVDDHDRLWMSTNKGISVLNDKRNAFTNYDKSDGLQGLEFNDQSAYKTDDGYYCYAGYCGFNIFNPDSIILNPFAPPLRLVSFKIFESEWQSDSSLADLRTIHLSYDQNFFSFTFAALNFDHPEKNQYACQLIGFDAAQQKLGYRPDVNYTNVPPGEYTLKIFSSNNDGVWNRNGYSLKLIITPPFWKTWWFYLLCLVTITAMLYGFYRLRINRLLAIQRVRTQISRDLHDEIGASLSSVHLMSSFAGQSLNGSSEDAKRWMNRIGDSTKEMMEKIRDIVWTLNSSNEISGNILTRMKQFASQTLEPKEIEFTFEEDEKAIQAVSDFIHKRNVYLIFKEAINNAAKYSNCTRVRITISITDGKFKMIIEDNGKGFDTTQVTSGNGLKNMMQRANQIHGRVIVESSTGNGTIAMLLLPIPHSWYRLIKSS